MNTNRFLDTFSIQNQILLLYLLSRENATLKRKNIKLGFTFPKRTQLKSHFKEKNTMAKSLLYGII